jgi:hypothetical protein
MTDRGWGRPFYDPIKVPGGKLVTLRDAGEYPSCRRPCMTGRNGRRRPRRRLRSPGFVRCRSDRGSIMQGHIFSGDLMGEWLVRDFSGAPVQNWMVVAGAIVLVCAVLAWLIRP